MTANKWIPLKEAWCLYMEINPGVQIHQETFRKWALAGKRGIVINRTPGGAIMVQSESVRQLAPVN